jgi:hypothetical protein
MWSTKLLLLITLSTAAAMEQTISVESSEEEAPVMVPKSEWSRKPHDEPGTLVDGRIKTKNDAAPIEEEDATGATGGATGMAGGDATGMTGGDVTGMTGGDATGDAAGSGHSRLVNNPREPQATSNQPCADCGTSQDKVEADGNNKRPIIENAHIVMHTSYNATGDYKGHGTPIEGTVDHSKPAPAEKCCRVCPPASECEDKDECFHKCKRVCGPTCSIEAPPQPCDKKKDENCDKKNSDKLVPITSDMIQAIADTPVEEKVAAIKQLLRGGATAAPKKAVSKDTGAVVVDSAVGAAL